MRIQQNGMETKKIDEKPEGNTATAEAREKSKTRINDETETAQNENESIYYFFKGKHSVAHSGAQLAPQKIKYC